MNERVDIQFKGLTTSPSDYACGDGELALCNNFVVKDGELAAFFAPDALPMSQTAFSSELDTILCVHRGSGFKNVIMYSSSSDDLKYIRVDEEYNTPDEDGLEFDDNPGEMPLSVETIGNILVFAYESGMRYYRWANGTYAYLGSSLPDLPPLSFGLAYNEDVSFHHLEHVPSIPVGATVPEGDQRRAFNDAVYGALNAEEADIKRADMFCYPFMLRFAFRLFDGSHVCPSAPVLMIPTNNSNWISKTANTYSGAGQTTTTITSELRAMKLYYSTSLNSFPAGWEDIIEGIDVFVTSPFRPHDTSAEVKYNGKVNIDLPASMGIYATCQTAGNKTFPDTIDIDEFGLREMAKDQNGAYTSFPSRSTDELIESGTFYHIAHLPLSEIKNTGGVAKRLPIVQHALETLETREVLKDDYISHCEIIPEDLLNYNSRLVAANLTRVLYKGQDPASYYPPKLKAQSAGDSVTLTRVKIIKNGVEHVVSKIAQRALSFESFLEMTEGNDRKTIKGTPLLYFFFPDPDAKAVQFVIEDNEEGVTGYVELELTRHATLNGAYWFGGLNRENYAPFRSGYTSYWPTKNGKIKLRSMMYMSEVNNPFYFPAKNATSVGTGNLLRIASSTRPLSEGQFGEFPLMAFTDEGIWAVSINGEGVASARQPISRDVLVSKNGLCNLDSALCFITKDGVNIIEGSKVTRISDSIRERGVDFDTFVPDAWWDELPLEGEQINFLDGIEHKIPAFSSRWKRIYVFDPNNDVSYTYDIKTGMWSSIKMENVYVQSAVDDYPSTLISGDYNSNNAIYNLNDEADDYRGTTAINRCTANIITRPMRLKMPDMPKTIHEGVIRGYFDRRLKDETSVPLPDINVPTPTSEDGDDADSNQRLPGTITPGGGTVGGGGSTTEIYTRKVVDCDVRQVLFGSNDLRHWYIVNSSVDQYLRGRFGTPYKWFRLLVVAPSTFDKDKRLTGVTFDVQPRLNNTLR